MAETEDNTSLGKTCKRCTETKAIDAFSRVSRRIGGHDHTCKACRNAARSPEARARRSAATRAWKEREREQHRALKRAQNERYRRARGRRPAADIAAEYAAKRESAATAKRLQRRTQIEARIRLKPWTEPSLTKARAFSLRYRLDPEFNLRQRLRSAERRRQRGLRISEDIRQALCRGGESPKVFRELGYSISELRRHIERQFATGMSWERFMAGEIHIDHRRPLSSFDLAVEDDWRCAWALTNLQPLWAADNLAKAASLTLLV